MIVGEEWNDVICGNKVKIRFYKIESFLYQKSYVFHIEGDFNNMRTIRFNQHRLPSKEDVRNRYIKYYIDKKWW